jgi:hypothetical protein
LELRNSGGLLGEVGGKAFTTFTTLYTVADATNQLILSPTSIFVFIVRVKFPVVGTRVLIYWLPPPPPAWIYVTLITLEALQAAARVTVSFPPVFSTYVPETPDFNPTLIVLGEIVRISITDPDTDVTFRLPSREFIGVTPPPKPLTATLIAPVVGFVVKVTSPVDEDRRRFPLLLALVRELRDTNPLPTGGVKSFQ